MSSYVLYSVQDEKKGSSCALYRGRRSKVKCTVQEEGKLCSCVLYSIGVRRGELIVLYTLQEEGEVSFCVLYIVQYIRKE